MKRFLLTTLLVAGLVIPNYTHAQFIDQKCWFKKDCADFRKSLNPALGESDANDGFVQDDSTKAACGGTEVNKKPIGFCLPAGQSTTKISFGGETKFENIGTFIKSMYRYTIWAAGILAAAMLIVAGFQWAASGGSSDAIGSAKNKIAGAISGLILLALSYVILNTVNPYLVNFRLPQIWLINNQGLVPPYCSQLATNPELANSKLKNMGPATGKIPTNAGQGGEYDTAPADAQCGNQYAVEKGGNQMCLGSKCGQKNQICLPFTYKDPDTKQNITPHCEEGDLVIRYSINNIWSGAKAYLPFAGLATNQLEDKNWLDYQNGSVMTTLRAVCINSDSNSATLSKDICISSKALPVESKTIRLTNTGLLPDYLVIYKNVEKKTSSEACGQHPLMGYLFKLEIKENWQFTDPNLWLAWTTNNQNATLGTFDKVFNTISNGSDWKFFESFNKNRYYLATPSDDDLASVQKNGWSQPSKICP